MSAHPVCPLKQDIPDDVMLEILSRLPVKSLVKFTCVCKSWYALLKNPIFIKLHSDHFASVDNNCYLLCHYDYYTDTTEFSLFSHETRKHTPIAIPCKGQLGALPSYNGLVCVTSIDSSTFGNSFMLLNPALSEIKVVPVYHSPESNSKLSKSICICVGFGFDKKNEDYKIVRIEQFMESQEIFTYVDVYSCNNDSWKGVNVDTNVALENHACGQFWNNSMFFCTRNCMIASFDVANETFSTMRSPGNGPIKAWKLDVWKDRLALIYYYDRDPYYYEDEDSDNGEDDDPDDDQGDDFDQDDDQGDDSDENPGDETDDDLGDDSGDNPGDETDDDLGDNFDHDDDQADDSDENPDDDLGEELGYDLDVDQDDDHFEVWTVRENNSWTKECSFHHDLGRICLFSRRKDSCDLLLLSRNTNRFHLYDEATKTFEEIDIPDHVCTITDYKESLITVNGKKMEKVTSSSGCWNVPWIIAMFASIYIFIVGIRVMLNYWED